MRNGDTLPCGALSQPDGSVRWRVWGPKARRVELVLLSAEQRRSLPMTPEGGGYFTHTEANIHEGQRYAYRLDNGGERPDPARIASLAWTPIRTDGAKPCSRRCSASRPWIAAAHSIAWAGLSKATKKPSPA